MSVEALKSLCDTAAVVLLFFTFVATAGALITGRIINGRQEAKLRVFDSDLTAAKTDLLKQQERTAAAEARTAILQSVVMPLDLTEEQQTAIGVASKQYAGRSIVVYSNPTDIEGRLLSSLIIDALRRGGVKATVPPQLGVTIGAMASGVTILGPDRQFAESLRNVLDTLGELNAKAPPPDKLSPQREMMIMVGVYPFKKKDIVAQ